MITAELLCASAVDLRRITTEARLLLVDRPAPADVDVLRSLRVQLVADLARFQQLVHLALDEAAKGGPGHLRQARDLKIGAIALSRAYDEFRSRWMERHFISNWAEYRLSALRMINTILLAIAPVDRLSLTYANDAKWRPIDATPIPVSVGGSKPRPGDLVIETQIEIPRHRNRKGMVG